ncbi:hypothetical protein SAMN05421857_4113 [Chryseobacterium formosense]|uniref:hypothetical protein n=1 Tax=Chryseobacterium formosense TaxID=236814 RepID=UPI0008E7A040|nr:hypothetical protein [Chryseobacterium formosense]SFT91961.1 hypothetical protein SAMN05421857_4113 [Chryseobacterium formosense]
MRTKIVLLFLLGWAGMVFSQISQAEKENAKKEILKLNSFHKKFRALYDETNEKLTQLKQNFSGQSLDEDFTKLQKQYKDAKVYNDTLARNYQLYLANKTILLDKGISEQEIDEWFGYKSDVFSKTAKKDEEVDTNVYMYFGKNKVLEEDIFKGKNDETSQILRSVINNKGEKSYFGDIIVPKNKEEFYFYKYFKSKEIRAAKNEVKTKQIFLDKNKNLDVNRRKIIEDSITELKKINHFVLEKKYDCGDYILQPELRYKFKKLDVEIKDGYFCDIRVFVEDGEGNEHIFTNQIGISILFFSSFGTRKMMNYKSSVRKVSYDAYREYTDEKMKDLFISLSDVMSYNYKVGNHYIPHDIALELPTKPEENEKGNAVYQIKQETYLEKILELRAYTDFLTLFGDSQNGLAQVEGRAKFYLFPYPFRFFGSKKTLGQIEYFPAVSPSVNYSRFEKDSRYVQTKLDSTNTNYEVKNDIDLVEKRYLVMGLDLEILKWQNKNAPVSLSLYGLLNYNISEMNIHTVSDTITKSVKAMGFGGGLHLSTKRFNNFGFDYKAEFSWYDFQNFNTYQSEKIMLPPIIPIFRNEVEVFYHPNGSPNQAIFARLITYNYLGSSNNQAFYQFQFGYKFAIGNRTVSGKD